MAFPRVNLLYQSTPSHPVLFARKKFNPFYRFRISFFKNEDFVSKSEIQKNTRGFYKGEQPSKKILV